MTEQLLFNTMSFSGVVSLLNLVAAIAILWYAARMRRAQPTQVTLLRDHPASYAQPPVNTEAVRAMLDRLRELVNSTARDVGHHNARVETVNRQLSNISPAGQDPLQVSLLAAAQQMLEGNRQLQVELTKAKTELHDHAKQIEVHMTEARTDALSGVPNRRAFDEELARRYATWRRHGTPLRLLMIDIDFFKKLNDTHGHRAGDEVLRGIGGVLATNVCGVNFVARYGGEEFVVILSGNTFEGAKSTATRIRTAIANAKFSFDGKTLQVTISAGLAELRSGDTEATLVEHADAALYAAKSNGRNRTFYHDGVHCLPIDPPSNATGPEPAKVVPTPKTGADLDEQYANRRAHPRYSFARTQRIAPLVDNQLPLPEMFREVQCRDISSGGFSFWLPEFPDFSTLVLALGSEGNAKYLIAKIAHSRKVERDGKMVFEIGARFTGRFDPNGIVSLSGSDSNSRGAATPPAPSPVPSLQG